MYFWHWLGIFTIGRVSGLRWSRDDWSLIATTSRTITHDWSYLSSSPIVSNRTLTRTTNRGERLQMDIIDWSYNQSEQLVTGRTADRATAWHTLTHDWSCDQTRLVVRPCQTIADRSRTVCNMTVDLVATDFARTITHDHYDQWHILSTIWQRFQHFSVVTWSFISWNIKWIIIHNTIHLIGV